jgi:hypothetical protein
MIRADPKYPSRNPAPEGYGYEAVCADCGRRSPVLQALAAVVDWLATHNPWCSRDLPCESCGGLPRREGCREGRP